MLLKIYPENPNPKHIRTVVECLCDGGIVIYPTDSVYGIGCDIFKSRTVERVAEIKGIKKENANFSFVCYDLSQLADFTKPINNTTFKLMKRALPGPFTFILEANNNVPKLFQSKKKTVGIRIPNNSIARTIVLELGNPLMSTSVHDDDAFIDYTTDPELIYERYKDTVDIVIDGGFGDNEPSTVVSCVGDEILVVRQGKGILADYL